tara:strand:+ start:221 stop:499 length:279 start_codon:yes stop_codon:yes gene_type:complete
MAKEYNIDGELKLLFTIGEVAKSIGKEPVTIRKWESKGVIPSAVFRDGSNRRLYTREQMQGLTELTGKYMKQGTKTPQEFLDGVKALFDKGE